MLSGRDTRNLPGTEKALRADRAWARGRAVGASVSCGAAGLCAPRLGQRGGGAESHLAAVAGASSAGAPWAASTAQTFPPHTRPETSPLLPCSFAGQGGSAFELAWWFLPAAGSFGDALVGSVRGGLQQGIFSFSHWAGGEDGETVRIVFVVVLLGRDGRGRFPWEGVAMVGRMEACILLNPEGKKVGVRPQPQSWLSGKCGCGKNTLARSGQPWVALS